MSEAPEMPSNVLLYEAEDGTFRLDVPTDGETVWLSQQQMADLFGKARSTIAGHIKNVFEEGELTEKVVCRDFRHTTNLSASSQCPVVSEDALLTGQRFSDLLPSKFPTR